MMTKPVTQDDCPVCGCVHDGQCLCTRPYVVPATQGEVCKICGKDTPHYHLRGTTPTPTPTPQSVKDVVVAWMTPGGDVSRSWLWAAERCQPGQTPIPLHTASGDWDAVRKVAADIRRCAGNNNAKFHLSWADKLTAALPESKS